MALSDSPTPTCARMNAGNLIPHPPIQTPHFLCNPLISRFSQISFTTRAVLRTALTLPSLIPFLGLKIQHLPAAFIPHSALRIPQFLRKSLISRFPNIFSSGFSRLLRLLAANFPVRGFGVFRGCSLPFFRRSGPFHPCFTIFHHLFHLPTPCSSMPFKAVPPCSATFRYHFLCSTTLSSDRLGPHSPFHRAMSFPLRN